MISESVFLIGGAIVGQFVMPRMIETIEQNELTLHPMIEMGMKWYWWLLLALASHMILWPLVPRVLGWPGALLWWLLGLVLPLFVIAVPAAFIVGVYMSVIDSVS